MSEDLKNVCENCGFKKEFVELLEGMERQYNIIAKSEEGTQDGESLSMAKWIIENTNIDELKGLTQREKFIYGTGVLMSEIVNY